MMMRKVLICLICGFVLSMGIMTSADTVNVSVDLSKMEFEELIKLDELIHNELLIRGGNAVTDGSKDDPFFGLKRNSTEEQILERYPNYRDGYVSDVNFQGYNGSLSFNFDENGMLSELYWHLKYGENESAASSAIEAYFKCNEKLKNYRDDRGVGSIEFMLWDGENGEEVWLFYDRASVVIYY